MLLNFRLYSKYALTDFQKFYFNRYRFKIVLDQQHFISFSIENIDENGVIKKIKVPCPSGRTLILSHKNGRILITCKIKMVLNR